MLVNLRIVRENIPRGDSVTVLSVSLLLNLLLLCLLRSFSYHGLDYGLANTLIRQISSFIKESGLIFYLRKGSGSSS